MYLRILLAAGAIALFLWLLRWFARSPPATVRRNLGRAAIAAVVGVLILLAATGRLHWLFALGAFLLAMVGRAMTLLSMWPLLRRAGALFKSGATSDPGTGAGPKSQVESRFLRMSLDHGSGSLDGQVLEGRHAGARLSELPLTALLELLRTCRLEDEESAQLLEAYLDRVHGADWRAGFTADAGQGPSAATGDTAMTAEEAYRILGIEAGADRDAIITAHRRLMQKLHPDRGGSGYLAARINQAKDCLLEEA